VVVAARLLSAEAVAMVLFMGLALGAVMELEVGAEEVVM
jgi:hypothetical protein